MAPGASSLRSTCRKPPAAPPRAPHAPRPRPLPAAAGVGGREPLPLGDVAARSPALPRVPIAYALWRGDEEFPPGASVVFDASVEGYLDAEVVTVLAELVTRPCLPLHSPPPDWQDASPDAAAATVRAVLAAAPVPLIIVGCGHADKDNDVWPRVTEAAAGGGG